MRRLAYGLLGLLALALVLIGIAAATVRFDHAPMPGEAEILNPERLPLTAAYDVMGQAVAAADADELMRTEEGRRVLSPENGAVRIDEALVALGRDAFYRETYGNEVFLTDILGLLDGGLTLPRVGFALAELGGRGTANLRVRIARDVSVGERIFRAGELVPTGLDVPRGEFVPLGIRMFYDKGQVRMGITCALCHAAVDPASGKVVEGAPNADLNVGLMMALSSNPSAYFVHTGVAKLDPYRTRPDNIVRTSTGRTETLPDPDALAREVRAMLGAWPPGSFDSTPDLVNNPTSIPSSFTAESHPYGWSGHAAIGAFRGLSALNNNVHGLNSDTTAQAAAAPTLFGLDPEVYLGTILQRAARDEFRFAPGEGRRPYRILAEADPTPGAPGLNRFAVLPTFPRANYVTVNGLVAARPGEGVTASIDGMSAFQNRLQPPPAERRGDLARGGAVFERAGCLACHSGPAFTSNRVWPVSVIGTEPSRARAFARTEAALAKPQMFAPGTPMPPPADPRLLDVPVPNEGQLKLAWAHNRTGGGYKVPSLIGLAWTSPYLHDGGVAVGPDPAREVGVAPTAVAGIPPDARNSLRALVDRAWRARVVEANRAAPAARLANVTGEGHPFWADAEAGYSDEDRDALVDYLLSLDRLQPTPPARPPGQP